ncbi:beta-N-acetylhexosaminidase [Streptomyces sp. NBC_00237]|uniref:beta-N-acetylhexosaminidase n=1 Tax=Streptomyces sp. NBC_00237 TaxID=2975687 RepID=UPI00224D5BE1|nr:beta-N-acetylhexosaminidase [Streptomyces sp. NBC_00237]MCX5201105.1 beta-N-acetylhexosaminidase [Streptomyces sp. NBC_00237]
MYVPRTCHIRDAPSKGRLVRHRRTIPRLLAPLLLVAVAGTASVGAAPAPDSASAAKAADGPRPLGQVIPAPSEVKAGGSAYTIGPKTDIRVGHSREAREVGEALARVLRPSTGYRLPVTSRDDRGGIRLKLAGKDRSLGGEGYRLESGRGGVTITARTSAGLFHGIQTLRQQLPAAVEKPTKQAGPWQVAGGTVRDVPRFGYRAVMLDVGRHFLTVEQVKRYVDQAALYKINTLRLHLTEDQGWRIAVDSWPRLATYGGSTQVGGGPGGYYTKAQYKDLVRYAASRKMEVVPEIDMPGHTNAALASYAELNCNGIAPPLYTGTEVGFSSLCASKPITYKFIDDVVREIAQLTPGKYINIGGDEAHSTSHEDFAKMMNHAQKVVGTYGKKVMGWHQLVGADQVKDKVVQYWGYDKTSEAERRTVVEAAKGGTKLVLSPADRSYLDMKYNKSTPLGLNWAGYVEVRRSYDWDPGSYLAGAPESSVLGVEAPLWTETLATSDQLEFMAYPRLPGIAELGWSPKSTHDWETYKLRLAQQGPRFDALGIDYYRSTQVPWPAP